MPGLYCEWRLQWQLQLGIYRDLDEEWRHRLAASQGSALRKNTSSRGWAGPRQIHSNRLYGQSIIYLSILRISWCLGGMAQGMAGSEHLDDILQYDSQTNSWSSVGKMSTVRTGHAMSLVPATVKQHCTSQSRKWVWKHVHHFIVYYYLNVNYQIKQ